ncbi:helix-turn-helix domain-containing protein [Verrucomicrobiota bacterium]
MKQKNDAQSEYVTTTELAALCGVSRFTIINWAEQGVIKCVKTVGGHRRILRSEALKVIKTLRGNGRQSSKTSHDDTADIPEGTPESKPQPEPQPAPALEPEAELELELELGSEPEQEVEEAAPVTARNAIGQPPPNDKQILKDVSYVMGRGLGGLKAGLSHLKTNLGGNGRGDLALPQ